MTAIGRLLPALPLVLLVMFGTAGAAAAAEERIALVIGNSAYRNVPALPNPASDARAMAKAVQSAGFELIGGGAQVDLDRAGLERVIREFGRRLGRDKVGLFYYAGHGVQVGGANYLVPVDANLNTQADVKYELVDAGYVLDEMTAANNRLNLVILDACRNNPFGGRGIRAVSRGLAQVTAPAGTLISYATQPGEVAEDGDGANSPYTSALVKAIDAPGLGIFDMFNRVGLAVKASTNGRQQPWVASSPIDGQFYFKPPPETGAPAAIAGTQGAGDASAATATVQAAPLQAAPPATIAMAEPPAAAPVVRGPVETATAVTPIPVPPAPAAPPSSPGPPEPPQDAGITMDTCPDNFYSVPEDVSSLTCGCPPGAAAGGIAVGDNPYAPQSGICTAARHAGAIAGRGGRVTVQPVADVPFFPAIPRSGVSTSGTDQPGRGFRVVVPGAPPKPDLFAADGGIVLEICPGNGYSVPFDAPSITCGCSAEATQSGAVLGDNPYGYGRQSSFCTAARHAGVLTGRGGRVTIVPVANAPFFPAVRRNGIASSGTDQGGPAFRIAAPGGGGAPPPAATAASPFRPDGGVVLELCPENAFSIPMDAPSLSCGCPAEAMQNGSVVGDNPYARQSGICAAARHAGILSSRGGQVTIVPVAGAPFFPAVKRNGISSAGLAEGGEAFRVVAPAAQTESPPPTTAKDRLLDTSGQQPGQPRSGRPR